MLIFGSSSWKIHELLENFTVYQNKTKYFLFCQIKKPQQNEPLDFQKIVLKNSVKRLK